VKLFAFSRETEVAAIDCAVQDERKRLLLYRVLDEFLRIVESGTLAAGQLEPFVSAMHEGDEAVWGRVGGRLAQLAHHFPAAASAILELLDDRKWRPRFNVTALASELPEPLAVQVLERSLADRSERVREKAADMALRGEFRAAIPLLQSALHHEMNPAIRESIDLALHLLQGKPYISNGYRVTRAANGGTLSEPLPVEGHYHGLVARWRSWFEGEKR
jgi:hypothetical protein